VTAPGFVVAGADGLNSTPGAGSVLSGGAIVLAALGLGLAATMAAGLDSDAEVENVGLTEPPAVLVVGEASTIRIGSSGELVVVDEKDGVAADCGAGDALISLRIVPLRAGLVAPPDGVVTIGGSVPQPLAAEFPELESVGVAAGGW
jgi:hypothetical protein